MLLMSGMAWGQTDTPMLVIGNDTYEIVSGDLLTVQVTYPGDFGVLLNVDSRNWFEANGRLIGRRDASGWGLRVDRDGLYILTRNGASGQPFAGPGITGIAPIGTPCDSNYLSKQEIQYMVLAYVNANQ